MRKTIWWRSIIAAFMVLVLVLGGLVGCKAPETPPVAPPVTSPVAPPVTPPVTALPKIWKRGSIEPVAARTVALAFLGYEKL